MQWITESDLVSWSKRVNARSLLADMVADLIRASISDATRFRFPGGDVGQLRGWDGDLETTQSVSFVPAGKSKWEFGVGAGAAKASHDYRNRTRTTDPMVMKENTLVLVNLEPWDTPRKLLSDWERDRRAEGKWLDVRYLDSVELVHWLDEHPAVAALYAREVLSNAPKDGALSTDEFWEIYSLQFNPQLHEKVVIADRQSIADDLLQKLAGTAHSIMLGAETSEEVVAFAVAAIRLAKPEVRRSFEVRTLIVESESAARFLSNRSGMIFITTKAADPMAGVLAQHGPTLSAAVGIQNRKSQIPTLHRPTASGMSEGFVAMGMDSQIGYELAHRCGRSLTVLRRLIPRGPSPRPEWEPKAPTLKPAFLAGGWSATSSLDKQILIMLSGLPDYPALESVLLPTLTLSDRPLDRLNEHWQVRSPVDAFNVYAQMLSDDDLRRFRDSVISVFSHTVAKPLPEETFSLTYSPPASYSNDLRNGLALTLLIIATMHDVGGLQMNGTTPQQYVDGILSSLPSWGKSHETLIALGDQTALLAEATPAPFLSALESMLEGASSEVAKIFFPNDDGIWGPSSPHIKVLWALETLAWDPKYLNRAAVVLAKLAELDPNPDSRVSNRPLNSLRAILVSWAPNTHASVTQRIACLDLILADCPTAGWQLLVKLMPQPQDVSSPTQKPKLRDAEPLPRENLTYGIIWSFEKAIAERAIRAAHDDEARTILLVKRLSSFRPDARSEIISFVEAQLSRHRPFEGSPIWHALREEVGRHEYFAEAEWAMEKDERDRLAEIVERYRPADPITTERQLFDDWMPHVGHYVRDKRDRADVEGLRTAALKRVVALEGTAGILRLARMVRVPSLVAQSLQAANLTEEQLLELLRESIATEAPSDIALYASAIGAHRFGEHWREQVKEHFFTPPRDPKSMVRLILGWSHEASTWAFVNSLGADVNEAYWRQIKVLPITGGLDDLLFAINEFRKVGRSLEVLGLVYDRMPDLSPQLILSLLTEGQRQIASGEIKMDTMLSYHLNETFLSLQARVDVKEEDIARQEYSYLPLLEHDARPLALHNLLAKQPAFFVEVLSHVFRGKNDPSDKEPTEQQKVRAGHSYRLLASFRTVPGCDNQAINGNFLNDWVDGVRDEATKAGLSEIADQYIGHILAHAPSDSADRFWPAAPICTLIERLSSKEVETGIRIECFNKRGVTSRGLHAGGDLERKDASKYREWSAATVRYPRTSALLLEIAEMWQRHGEEEDVRAELRKMER